MEKFKIKSVACLSFLLMGKFVYPISEDLNRDMTTKPLETSSFYGASRSVLSDPTDPLPATEPVLPSYLSDPLLGPSKVWKIFRRQVDALEHIAYLGLAGELLPFSYESNWERLFLVANPDVFWFRDCQKSPHTRNTYEIIAENAVAKLYFDLEYDRTIEANKDCDGNEMTRTLTRVVLYYIHKVFGVKYKMHSVLVLDSSTQAKFSTHLVFQTPLVFRNNIHAGNFVRFIANELINIDAMCSDEEQLGFDIFKETTINVYAIKDLFVTNAKQARVLFCDLGVYSRNRLFRVYKSTKQGKNAPLVRSSINKFTLRDIPQEDEVQYERYIFLHSLITYFLVKPEEEMIKEFEKPLVNPNYCSEVNLRRLEKLHTGQLSPTKTSPYPALDNFIRTRIRPYGSIFRNLHFPSTNVTVYDIKGYRYCGNIGRAHKSQNIKLIADVNRGVYYQKCHDSDCADYKSAEWPIPPEIMFKIKPDEEDSLLENLDQLEELLTGLGTAPECESPSIIKLEESCDPHSILKVELETSESGNTVGSPSREERIKVEDETTSCLDEMSEKIKSTDETHSIQGNISNDSRMSSSMCTVKREREDDCESLVESPCKKNSLVESPCKKNGLVESPCKNSSSRSPCIGESRGKNCDTPSVNRVEVDGRCALGVSRCVETRGAECEPLCIEEMDVLTETPCIQDQSNTPEPVVKKIKL